MFKLINRVLLATLIITAIVIAFNWQNIGRLYTVITLFDKALIVNNFSNMSNAFFNKKIVHTGSPYMFETDLKPLPNSFIYRDHITHTDEFLARRATTALLVLKNNKIFYEKYFLGTTQQDKRISWSMAKSFVSILFGIQVDAGKIDINKGCLWLNSGTEGKLGCLVS